MQLVLCILASIGEIFLKIHFSHFTRFRYKQRKLCCDPSVIISNLLEQQCTLFPNHGFHEMDLLEIPSLELHIYYLPAESTELHSNDN